MAPAQLIEIELSHEPPADVPPNTIILVKISTTTINAYWNNHPDNCPDNMICMPLNAKKIKLDTWAFPQDATFLKSTIPYETNEEVVKKGCFSVCEGR